MKRNAFSFPLLLLFFAASAILNGADVPAVAITVKQNGKVVKQTESDANGNFVIGSLPEGPYSMEFRARRSEAFKNQQFSIGVDGIKQAGSQGVAGDSLVGGVAVNVEVPRGSTVRGQIAIGTGAGKKLVWVPPMLGSNMPGHWAEEGSADHILSMNRGNVRRENIQRIQDKGVTPR